MYLYRAVNDNDIFTLKINEGLHSKDVTEAIRYSSFCFIVNNTQSIKEYYLILNKEDKQKLYNSFNCDDIYFLHDLSNLTNMKISKIKNLKDLNPNESYEMREALSTVNAHLIVGSRYDTKWISFSKNIHNIETYYLNRLINNVAVVDLDDLTNNYDVLTLDLSTRESINKLRESGHLITKNYDITDSCFHGFNYSICDKEVIFYSHIPQNAIITVLEPLQVDLIYNNIFNEEFYKMSKNIKRFIYENFKAYLKTDLSDNLSDIEKIVFYEHYLNCKSLSSLSKNNNDLYRLLIYVKKQLLQKIPMNLVTSKLMTKKFENSIEKIILPEEKRYSK